MTSQAAPPPTKPQEPPPRGDWADLPDEQLLDLRFSELGLTIAGSWIEDRLAALAREMNLAMAEVFEVATFYHHFDVVKESASAPPRRTSAFMTARRTPTAASTWARPSTRS